MDLTGKQIEVANCPCCDSSDLDVGVQSASTMGVKCRKCRLTMVRSIPHRWPSGVWKTRAGVGVNMHRLEVWTLLQAVKAWNRRPKKKGKA